MRKKGIRIGIILLVFLLIGCQNQNGEKTQEVPTTITIWHYYNGKSKEAFDALVEEFNQGLGLEKNILVTAESKGDIGTLMESVEKFYQNLAEAEAMPDIFATYRDTAFEVNKRGLLADIGQYMTAEEIALYNPFFIEEGRLEADKLHIFPVAKSTELFYMNNSDWKAFAQEKGYRYEDLNTWENIRKISEDYYQWSGGRTFFGRDAVENYLLVGFEQLGQDFYEFIEAEDGAGKEDFRLQKIWRNYAEPYIQGYYGAYGRFRSDDIKTGDIVAAVGSTVSVSYYPKEVTRDNGASYPIEIIVLPLPNFEGTQTNAVQQGAGMAVTKSDENKERAAVEFLKWFTNEERNIEFSIATGYFPVQRANHIDGLVEDKFKEIENSADTLLHQNLILGWETLSGDRLYVPIHEDEEGKQRKVIHRYLTSELDPWREAYQSLAQNEQEEFLDQAYIVWAEKFIEESKEC